MSDKVSKKEEPEEMGDEKVKKDPNPEMKGDEVEMNGSIFPLAIPEILEHVLSFLPIANLKNLRLVNQAWNDAVQRVILKKQQQLGIVLCSYGGTESHKCGINDVPKLISVINSSARFPSKKFTLRGSAVRNDATRKLAMQFLKAVAPFATELFVDDFISERIFSEDLIEFPVLKALRICYIIKEPFDIGPVPEWEPDYWEHWEDRGKRLDLDIIKYAPNLQKLQVDSDGSTYMNYVLDLLEVPNGRKISSLTLPGPFHTLEELTKLAKLQLSLTHLSFTDYLNESSKASRMAKIKAFLLTQSATLESLHLEITGICRDLHLESVVPEMPKLKKFSVEEQLPFKNMDLPLINFLFPVLTTFQGQRIMN